MHELKTHRRSGKPAGLPTPPIRFPRLVTKALFAP